MIRPEELRIGNYVYFINEDIPHKITFIHYDVQEGVDYSEIACEDTANRPVDDFSPISLTEKWLYNFGFGLDDKGIKNFHNLIELLYDKIIKTFDSISIHITHGKKIEYVHELQNFFYALTGEELQIK